LEKTRNINRLDFPDCSIHPDSNMDIQDSQDDVKSHESISRSIIGCAIEVINELGIGFLESVYEKARIIALSDKGLSAESQHEMIVHFRRKNVGQFYADLLVDGKVLVELKAGKSLLPENQVQIINYLNVTGIEVGLLINFGKSKLKLKRFTRTKRITE